MARFDFMYLIPRDEYIFLTSAKKEKNDEDDNINPHPSKNKHEEEYWCISYCIDCPQFLPGTAATQTCIVYHW